MPRVSAVLLCGLLFASGARAQSDPIYTYTWFASSSGGSGTATPTLDQTEAALHGYVDSTGNTIYASAGLSFPIYTQSSTWSFQTGLDYRPYGGLSTTASTSAAASMSGSMASTPAPSSSTPPPPSFKVGISTGQPPLVDSCNSNEGDPCSMANGNEFHEETDFTWGAITYKRYYNSLRVAKPYAAIDYNWSASFSQRVLTSALMQGHGSLASPTAPFITVQNENGHAEFFKQVTVGTTTIPGVFRSTVTPGKVLQVITYTSMTATTYTFGLFYPDGHREWFDNNGRLYQIQYPDDPRRNLQITYLSGGTDTAAQDYWLPSEVIDSLGRYIQFSYQGGTTPGDPYAHLASLQGGVQVSIPAYGPSPITLLQMQYDSNGNLKSVTHADSTVRNYKYSEAANLPPNSPAMPHNLTGIVDENNNRYADFTYDAYGRAASSWEGGSTIKANAFLATFTSDAQVSVSRSSGETVTYNFSPVATDQTFRKPLSRNQTAATLADGPGYTESWVYGYQDPTCVSQDERLCRYTNANGVVTEHQYDSLFERVRIEGKGTSDQRRIETDYNLNTYRVSERRVYGLQNGTDVELSRTSYAYDSSSGALVAKCEIDPNDSVAMSYACSAAQTPPMATTGVRRWVYSYCTASDPDPNPNDTTLGCPGIGWLKSITDPRGETTTFLYHQTEYFNDCGNQNLPTAEGCYAAGDLAEIINAAAETTTYANYDAADRIVALKDPNGVYTVNTYDARERLLTRQVESFPTLATTHFGYDNVGSVKTVTDADNITVTYGYDTAHRLTDITDAAGDHIHYALDALGNRTNESTYDPTGTLQHALSRGYDLLNRLWTTTDALNHVTTMGYDANDNPATTVDANSIVAHQDYDGLNRLKDNIQNYKASDPTQTGTQNVTTKYAYDARDNLVQVIDPNNLPTTYTYDGLNNLHLLQSPDTGATNYTSDLVGNRLTQQDARGQVATYGYDGLNRLTGITYTGAPGLNVVFAYDQPANTNPPGISPLHCIGYVATEVGHMTQITDSTGSTLYCHDQRGNIAEKVQATNGHAFTVKYGYTSGDRLQTLTYPSGGIITYGFDAAGRLNSITYKANATAAPLTLVSGVSYLPFGPLSKITYGDNHTLSKSYNANYWISGVNSSLSTGLALGYGEDSMGNIVALQEGATALSYQYDPLYRLSALSPSGSGSASSAQANPGAQAAAVTNLGVWTGTSFTYSATGDRARQTNDYQNGSLCAAQTATYNYVAATHWLGSITSNTTFGQCYLPPQPVRTAAPDFSIGGTATTTYAHDANGNTTSRGDGGTYTYDARNRLGSVAIGGSTFTYLLNGRGERVGKMQTINGTTTAAAYYVYNEGGQLLGEYSGTGAAIQEYVYLNDLPVAEIRGNLIYYIETDHLGTPRAVIDPNQSDAQVWLWNLDSDPFGLAAPTQHNDRNGQSFVLNLRFPGQYFDAETGLAYNYFRDYEPGTGRYVESDPTGLRSTINTFGYVDQNPLHYFDVQGLFKHTFPPPPEDEPPPPDWQAYGLCRATCSFIRALKNGLCLYLFSHGLVNQEGYLNCILRATEDYEACDRACKATCFIP